MEEHPEMLAIVRALARHLREYPQHCDTAAGIATWWFRDHSVVDGRALDDALAWMLDRHLIEVLRSGGSPDRYRRSCDADALDDVLQRLAPRRPT